MYLVSAVVKGTFESMLIVTILAVCTFRNVLKID